jgi:hypothetical protein
VPGVKAGSASLLRLAPPTRVRRVLLAVLVCAVTAPVATAATPAPDPSPLGGTAQPDPFPAAHSEPAPSPPPTPAPRTTFHVTPVISVTPVMPAAPATVVVAPAVKHQARHAATRTHPARVQHHKSVSRALPAAALRRIFTDPVQAIPLVAGAVDQPADVSKTLAIALGVLVLLSAGFVAVAAREMAH